LKTAEGRFFAFYNSLEEKPFVKLMIGLFEKIRRDHLQNTIKIVY